jgi:hypothetical protein
MPATTAFAAPRLSKQSLWSGLSLHFTRLPLSLYTFHAFGTAWLGITIQLSRAEASPNLTDSTSAPETNRKNSELNVIRLQPNFGGHMEEICLVCEAKLSGRQTKFCSRQCKNASTNNKHQNYVSQQQRGRHRRQSLIQKKGGHCEQCGYSRNQAALAFHHLDPATKSFPIDLRNCSNTSWKAIIIEARKCLLLCLNCHAEIHNPDFST